MPPMLYPPMMSPIRVSILGLMACAAVAGAQENAGMEKALEKFFALGLPEAKGGKWVMLSRNESDEGRTMPGDYNTRYSGNAWLLREERGVIEAVTADGRIVRGKRVREDDAETRDEGPLPLVQIRPGNLDQDLKVFSAALKAPLGRESSGEDESTAPARIRVAGGSLLFLAQLQRQGRGDFVRAMLPQVFGVAKSPEQALDGAVSLLADAQLAGLARNWTASGDAARYASALDALAAKFPRGWERREAAVLLAARVREQKAAPLAAEPDAKQAAEFLLKLKAAQIAELPVERNWLLPGGGRPSGEVPGLSPGEDDEEPAEKPAGKDSPVGAFFAKKREAAMALAKLLDDRRYLRAERDANSRRHESYGERKSREELVRQQYDQLVRPHEMGELAWALLHQLLPDEIRREAEEHAATRARVTLAWMTAAAAKTDDELAWDYLRSAHGTYDPGFRSSLRFLVERGTPETLVQLREVFLDPGVWNSSSLGAMLPQVEKFVQRAPADAAFPDQLRAATKAGLDAEEAENRTQYSGADAQEMLKQRTAQRTAQMKQLDRLFKPAQPLAEQLAEIVAMEETEAVAALQAGGEALMKRPPAEIEAPFFQAAARAKSAAVKQQLIQAAMGAWMRAARGKPGAKGDGPPPLPADPATREALLTLLRDETAVADRDGGNQADQSTVADLTAGAVIWPHCSEARQNEWQGLYGTAPHLVKKWTRAHALAIVSGQPEPPLPDAAKIPAGKASALVAELGALAAKDVAAALDAKTPDEQLAVIAHLTKAAEWPAAVRAAHFTVRRVSQGKVAEPAFAAWAGRVVDEPFFHEVEAAVQKAVAGGKCYVISVGAAAPLAGAEIGVQESPQRVPAGQLASMGLPGLPVKAGQPAPVGLAMLAIQSGGDDERRASRTAFGFPIWKDEAATGAWRVAHGQAKPAAADEPQGNRISPNPGPFEKKLHECLALKPGARGPWQVQIFTAAIGENNANE